jgi:hypothetical protein
LLKHKDLAEQKCHNTLFTEQEKQCDQRDHSCTRARGVLGCRKKEKGTKHAHTIPNIRKMAKFII